MHPAAFHFSYTYKNGISLRIIIIDYIIEQTIINHILFFQWLLFTLRLQNPVYHSAVALQFPVYLRATAVPCVSQSHCSSVCHSATAVPSVSPVCHSATSDPCVSHCHCSSLCATLPLQFPECHSATAVPCVSQYHGSSLCVTVSLQFPVCHTVCHT